MPNTAHEDYESLTEPQRERLSEITSTWRGLGIVGCEACRLPDAINSIIDGEEDTFSKGMSVGQLVHYTIELNGLKRPAEQGARVETDRLDDFDDNALFAVLMRLGVDEDDFEQVSSSFQECMKCPNAIRMTGDTPTFEEAKAQLESELR